jgi:hypothetical protein
MFQKKIRRIDFGATNFAMEVGWAQAEPADPLRSQEFLTTVRETLALAEFLRLDKSKALGPEWY